MTAPPAPFQTTPGTRPGSLLCDARPELDLAGMAEAVSAPAAQILDVMVEADDRVVVPFLPPALHITLPAMATMTFYACDESNIGPFSLAQVRISCRLGARPRGLALGCYVSGSAATLEALRSLGFDARPGTVSLRTWHHRVEGRVEHDGREILRASGVAPVAVSSRDLGDMPTLLPVRLREDGALLDRLVQVDSEVHTRDGLRSAPSLDFLDPEVWGGCAVRCEYPVRALSYRTDLIIHRPTFILDPDGPTSQASRRVSV